MRDIDHDPNERRQTNAIWWIIWPIVVFNIIGYFVMREPDWWSLSLGGFFGGVLATFAIEITGNKVPNSWRR